MSSSAQSIQFLLSQVRASGVALSGGQAFFYSAGTTTLKTVWLDRGKTTPAANPYTLDSNATAQLYGDGLYRVVIQDSNGVEKYDRDNQSFKDSGGLVGQVSTAAELVAAITAAGSTPATIEYGEDLTLTANLNSPANIELMPLNGAKIIRGAYTISYAGSTARWPHVQMFDTAGTGVITFAHGTTKSIPGGVWWGAVGDGATDSTAAMQASLNAAWEAGADWEPLAGNFRVTGLTLPGNASNRHKHFAMRGQGCGELFARTLTGAGTIISSITDAPILYYSSGGLAQSSGTADISRIRFEGNSTTPVIDLEVLYGQSEFHHNGVYQAGIGDGIRIKWSGTGEIHHNYVLNKDWATFGLGAARVGIGFNLSQITDTGLMTLRKNTSRGFHTAYKIGDGAAEYFYNLSIRDSESSVNYNGIHLTSSARGCVVDNNYFESGEGGIGILDEGNYNRATNNFMFAGYLTGISSPNLTYGNLYTGNTLAAGSTANTTLLKIASTSTNGGPGKIASGNMFAFSGSGGSVAGVKAIEISGVSPRLDLSGNSFDPRGKWIGGAGTVKISNLSTGGGVFGIMQVDHEDTQLDYLSRVGLSLGKAQLAVTESSFSGGFLTLPEGVSYAALTPTIPINVTVLTAGTNTDRFLILRATNGNTTIANNPPYVTLAGTTSFVGPGTITFIAERVGSYTYAYEIARAKD